MQTFVHLKAFSDQVKPDPFISFTEWANKKFYLPKESSSEHGRYRTNRTPFVEEILFELSPMSKTEVCVAVKPTQLAGTTIGLIFLCGCVDLYPGPILFMQPTDSMARSFSKKKLAPTIKHIPSLKSKIREPKSRDSGNTILQKDFPGGSMMLTGSNSGASYRAESIKYLILDDFDGFEIDIEGEGSPEELADRRTGTFSGRKIYINSTTTEKGISNIERAFEHSSQGFFHVPCPHCGFFQYLEWGGTDAGFGVKFTRDESGQVVDCWYQCKCCHKRIDEHEKTWMFENGKYEHKYPNRKTRGFRWNALYTPLGWVNSWAYIATKFLEANKERKEGNPSKYKTWLNSFMAEAYEEMGEQPEWVDLKARMEPYQPLSLPEPVKVLTAGVDVQHNRLAVSIYGWAKGEECWLIYHVEIVGDVMQQDVWDQLDLLINRPFQTQSGIDLHIVSAGVDAGDGQTTQSVRNYCRFRGPKVFALKGQAQANKPVIGLPTKQDLTWKGEKIEDGVEIWPVGSDTAKNTLYARLKVVIPGPGMIHFYMGLDDEFFKQLTAEKLVTRFVKGYPVKEWHNVRANKRNESIDCFCYAYSAAVRAGVSYIDFDKIILMPRPVDQQPKRRERPQHNTQKGRW
jgi:terminase, large subunit